MISTEVGYGNDYGMGPGPGRKFDVVRSQDRGSDVRKEVSRILASRSFQSSRRLSRFLEFIVEQTLAGNQENLKEYAIGIEVCERGPAFDPRIDPIVRIDARRLRTRLRDYYLGEGISDPLRITLEAGSYIPSFHQLDISRTAALPLQSIVVLPIQKLGGGAEEEVVAEGLTEGLISALSCLRGLTVVSRTSSLAVKTAGHDAREIGEILGVGAILEGSVQHSAGRWRITINSVSAASGRVAWSRVFDCADRMPFQLQDDIAGEVCRQMGLAGSVVEHPVPVPSGDSYALYWKGRHQLLKWNPASVNRAIEMFEAALQADPKFAQAQAGLAAGHNWLGLYGVCNPKDAFSSSRNAAEKAIGLDPCNAEAWSALGTIRAVLDWNWAGADRDFRHAFELNRSFGDSMALYATLLAFQGRFRESQEIIDRATVVDPLSLVVRSQRAVTAAFSGDAETAIRLYEELLEIEPRFHRAHWAMAILLSRLSRYDEALSHYELARVALGEQPFLLGWQGHCLALAGHHDKAREIRYLLDHLAQTRFISQFSYGLIDLGIRDYAAALSRFERACDEHTIWVLELAQSGSFEPLHGNATYQKLLRRMNLV